MSHDERVNTMDRWRRVATMSWAIIGVTLLFAIGLYVLGRITSAITPFVLALVVVFLLRKPVAAFERRGLSRSLGVFVCYVMLFAVITVAGIFIVPPVSEEVRDFGRAFPSYFDSAYELWLRIEYEYMLIEMPDWIDEIAESSRQSVVTWITDVSANVARGIVALGGQVAGFLVNVFLAFALAFFVLRDLPTLKAEVLSLPGRSRQEETFKLAADVTNVLEGFVRGQLIIATIIATLTGVGLWLLGVPYALVIGLIAGVTNLIPYLGPLIAGVIAAISAAFVSPQLVLFTVAWFVLLQQVESTFLQPKVMSDQVHLHPVLVILSLLVGATLFGLVGMLVAVPLAAVGRVLFIHYFEKWTDSRIAAEDGALFRRVRPAPESAARARCDDQGERYVATEGADEAKDDRAR